MKNTAPPCLYERYGNLQKLPSPTADPMAARMKVALLDHLYLFKPLESSSAPLEGTILISVEHTYWSSTVKWLSDI